MENAHKICSKDMNELWEET